jgi:hypothetical protein
VLDRTQVFEKLIYRDPVDAQFPRHGMGMFERLRAQRGNQTFNVAIHMGATNLLRHAKGFDDVLESIGIIRDQNFPQQLGDPPESNVPCETQSRSRAIRTWGACPWAPPWRPRQSDPAVTPDVRKIHADHFDLARLLFPPLLAQLNRLLPCRLHILVDRTFGERIRQGV